MDIFLGNKKDIHLLENCTANELKKLYKVSLFPSIYLTIVCLGPIGSFLFQIYDGKKISGFDILLIISTVMLLIGNWLSFYWAKSKAKKQLNFVMQNIESSELKEINQ
jgi:pilus assembly protein TadC